MKKIEPLKFVRKPIYVDAVRVTSENMHEVAEWCGCTIKTTTLRGNMPSDPYIKIPVHRPINPRQTQAFAGDWVLYSLTGLKTFTDKAFHENFERALGVSWIAKDGEVLREETEDEEQEGSEDEEQEGSEDEEREGPTEELKTMLSAFGEGLLKISEKLPSPS